MRMPRAMLCLLFLFLFSSASYSQKRPDPRDEVEVFHWWVSGGERDSRDVLRGYWVTAPIK